MDIMWRNLGRASLMTYSFKKSSKSSPVTQIVTHKKSLLGEKIKRLRREERLLFGKLIETKKEKVKRIKLEDKGVIPKSIPSQLNHEKAWIRKTTSKITFIKMKEDEPVFKKVYNIVQTNVNKTTTNYDIKPPQSEKSTLHDSTGKTFSTDTTTKNKDSETPKQKDPLLSKSIVKHLLDFPIFDDDKRVDNKWSTNESKILSVTPMDDVSCLKFPTVTKILSATMTVQAKAALEQWKMRMIEQMGLKEFELHQANLLNDGQLLHSAIANYFLNNQPCEVSTKVKQSLLSLKEVLQNIESVQALESHVIHSKLLYRGTVDCVAVHRGDLCLIDWKQSDKAKDTIGATYDAPLQLASYIGALNSDPVYPVQIQKGLIVVAYTNGEPAKVHEVSADSLHFYWKLWLQRLQNYHIALNTS